MTASPGKIAVPPGAPPPEPAAQGLQAGLKNRHLSVIAIGGVIGRHGRVGVVPARRWVPSPMVAPPGAV
ncbi:hypothetical protein [Streptomyces paradoxus]|uniref:hypothetical protein n=1 Tax=Streptomyces paradoxus TaxID=66375 RepID=UPI0037D52C83